MSSEIYELMKRPDEMAVVVKAHEQPRFVEDCVREMVRQVVEGYPDLPDEAFVMARQENLETIHRHNVVAERYGTLGDLRAELASGEHQAHHLTMREWLEAPAQPRSRLAARLAALLGPFALLLLDPLAQAEEVVGAADHGDGQGQRRRGRRRQSGAGLVAIRAKTAAIWSTVFSLAEPAGGDHDAALGGDRAEDRDRDLAGDDHHRHPGFEPVERDQRDQGADDQQLVGERVHQLAEGGDRVARAGEVAVEAVGQRPPGRRRRRRGRRRSGSRRAARRRPPAPPGCAAGSAHSAG